jgi:hypothetical protein
MHVIFTHIEKTAGSSIHEGVYGIIGPERMYIVKHDQDGADSLFHIKHTLSYVGGHIRFSEAFELFGDSVYIAAIRNPVERILSNYFFDIRAGLLDRHPYHETPQQEFGRYYELSVRAAGKLNRQCRYFSDDGTATSAQKSIQRHYSLIWDSSLTDRVWPLIGCMFPQVRDSFPITIRKNDEANVPPMCRRALEAPVCSDPARFSLGERPKNYRDFLDADTLHQIEQDNEEDMQLYAWLNTHCGIYLDRNRLRVESLAAAAGT